MTTHDLLPSPVTSDEEELDPFVEATLRFETAARRLDLEDWIVRRLRHMERELTVNLPLSTDAGEVMTVAAWRMQHSLSRGPTLGGVQLAPAATPSLIRAAAMATTWECALFDLPFAGSAGAIVCDPGRLAESELRALVKAFMASLRGFVGSSDDVITPDLGSNPQIAAWMFDGYVHSTGRMEPGVVTGKPAALWGLPDYDAVAARGLCLLLQSVLAERSMPLAGARIAVQGFGKLGARAARQLHDSGARVVAVADLSGGVLNQRGLNIPELQSYAETNRLVFGFPEGSAVSNAEVLECACDVLVAAAAEHQITVRAAPRVRASVVLEAVKQTTTPAADQVLQENGTVVVPDMLANGTRLLASFAEWMQNTQRSGCPSEEQREAYLKSSIERAFAAVRYVATRDQCSLRGAAELLAVDRVATVMRLRA